MHLYLLFLASQCRSFCFIPPKVPLISALGPQNMRSSSNVKTDLKFRGAGGSLQLRLKIFSQMYAVIDQQMLHRFYRIRYQSKALDEHDAIGISVAAVAHACASIRCSKTTHIAAFSRGHRHASRAVIRAFLARLQ